MKKIKDLNKETCLYYYQVVIYHPHRAERYCYGLRRRAYSVYSHLLSRLPNDCSIVNVHFQVICQRFDNAGSLYIGFGTSKYNAYKDSFNTSSL